MTDDEIIGSLVHSANGKARVLVCSQLLGVALVERLDDDGEPTGRHATLNPNNLILKENA